MTKNIFTTLALFCLSVLGAVGQEYDKYSVATSSLKHNWYVQAGLDMTLQNPCYYNFSHVFPKGKTFGIHAAVGKWFTPGLNLRVKMMWDNGIVGNDHLEWIAPFGRNGINHDKGGVAAIYGEVQLCFTNVIMGYDESRRWDISAYPRMGLIRNFAIGSATPVIGVGIINTYKITPRLSLYYDMAYNMTTTEYTQGGIGNDSWSGGGKNGNANGYFDFNVGVQINLGKSNFSHLSK